MPRRIVTTDTDAGTVTVLEREGRDFKHLTTIPVGNGPRGAVRITGNGRGYVGNSCGDTVSEIDLVSCREVGKIKVGAAPTGVGLTADDRYLLVSNSGSNSISVVDLAKRQEVATVPVGREPKHMAITPDGSSAYVAVFGGHYVAQLDLSSLTNKRSTGRNVREVARIPVGDGAHPYSVGLSPDGREAYVANNQASYVSVISLESGTVVAKVDVKGKGARGVAFEKTGRIAYVSIEDRNQILAIDTSKREIVEQLQAGPGPRGMAIDSEFKTIIASAFARVDPVGLQIGGRQRLTLQNSISIIDLSATELNLEKESGEPTYSELPVGAGPCSVAIVDLAKSHAR